MDSAEYRQAVAIARRACQGWSLSRQDWEEVEQDAAVEAWRTGSVTRIWWGAVNSARRICHSRRAYRPVVVPLSGDFRAGVDVEAEVVGQMTVEHLMARLRDPERRAVEVTVLDGLTQADAAATFGTRDSTVSRRRAAGLSRLRSSALEC